MVVVVDSGRDSTNVCFFQGSDLPKAEIPETHGNGKDACVATVSLEHYVYVVLRTPSITTAQ